MPPATTLSATRRMNCHSARFGEVGRHISAGGEVGQWQRSKALTRAEVEEFLINEAALLDDWRLPEWRQLFAPDCRYLVPDMGGRSYASPDFTLFLIADDEHHLTERVKRLGKRTAHAEYPALHHAADDFSNVQIRGESTMARPRCKAAL